MTATRKSTFGEQVRKLRTARGTSLRRFADQVSLSQAYLSMVERDKAPPPTEPRILAIAEALDANPDELLASGGRVSSDVVDLIVRHPKHSAELLRRLSELEEHGTDAEGVLRLLARVVELLADRLGAGTTSKDAPVFDFCAASEALRLYMARKFPLEETDARCETVESGGGSEADEDVNKGRERTAR